MMSDHRADNCNSNCFIYLLQYIYICYTAVELIIVFYMHIIYMYVHFIID